MSFFLPFLAKKTAIKIETKIDLFKAVIAKVFPLPAPKPEPKPTIVDVVLETSGAQGLDDNGGDFDILREALTAAGLVDTLADRDADFTVFAPTDAAFIQLARDLGADIADGDEQAALDAILAALTDLGGGDPIPLLTDILLYHVAPEGRTLRELNKDGTVTTAQGGTIDVDGKTLADAEPDIADPTVVAKDLHTANGTIQVIDRVLLPIDIPGNEPPLPNIVDIATGSDDFTILVKALSAAGLVETVQMADDITVFAPTDAAFRQLADDLGFKDKKADDHQVFDFLVQALTDLGGGDPIPLLTDILLYHVSPGAKTAAEIDAADSVETLLTGATFGTEGTELVDNEPDIENPEIVGADVAASNGTVQVIDRVLLPLDIPGNEVVEGETIVGSRKRDHLVGTEGNDEIFGKGGRDKLFGGDGDDHLDGGWGRDLLAGGAGDDHLTGGWGRDSFDFRDILGHDTVKDFSRFDKLILSKDDFANVHEVFEALEEVGHDVVIAGDEGSITLKGVDAHDLGAHSFHFV